MNGKNVRVLYKSITLSCETSNGSKMASMEITVTTTKYDWKMMFLSVKQGQLKNRIFLRIGVKVYLAIFLSLLALLIPIAYINEENNSIYHIGYATDVPAIEVSATRRFRCISIALN